jgi:hypothetical protein
LVTPIADKTGGMAVAGYSTSASVRSAPTSTETLVAHGIVNGIGFSAVLWAAVFLIFI